MLKSQDRTMDLYLQVGAEMRLLESLTARLTRDLADVADVDQRRKFARALRRIREVRAEVEDRMLTDHEGLTLECEGVFNGGVESYIRHATDAQQIDRAKETAQALFGVNWYTQQVTPEAETLHRMECALARRRVELQKFYDLAGGE